MSNKRISELTPLTAAEMSNSDLFAIADVSVPETKKATIAEVAQWVANSASLSIPSASYSKSASFLLYSGNPNGTSSFSISSSWSAFAYSASLVISASNARSSSYALTASCVVGVISGVTAVLAYTASYLDYTGAVNGTASYALSSSVANRSLTSSYVSWFGGSVDNGTVYRSISSSYSTTASVLVGVGGSVNATASWALNAVAASTLNYDGATPNGTASYAMTALTASQVVAAQTVTNEYIMREFGPLEADIFGGGKTASFGYFQVTSSAGNPKLTLEAWGDIWVPMASSSTQTGSLVLNISSSGYNIDLDISQPLYSVTAPQASGSTICRFFLKGFSTIAGSYRFDTNIFARNGLVFVTGSGTEGAIKCNIRANTDSLTIE